jgi:hypothetical protein
VDTWSSAYTVDAPIDNAPVVTTSDLKAQHGQSWRLHRCSPSATPTATDDRLRILDSGAGGAR